MRKKMSNLLKLLDEAAATGADLSPGDSLAAEAAKTIRELQQRLLTAAGDDLCRLSQEEIEALSLKAIPIPPKEEFLSSCGRFWMQIASEAGVNHNCLTLAQLVAENQRLSKFESRFKWLELREVEVREPLVHGSKFLFHASPEEQEGEPDLPSDLIEQIDMATTSLQNKPR